MNHVQFTGVSKQYSTVLAVDSVDFSFQMGSITALLGPNGAGKSSLLRMLTGFTKPDSGAIAVQWQGKQYDSLPHEAFAYLPEDRGLYEERTVLQNLQYIGRLKQLEKSTLKQQIDKWLNKFDLIARQSELLSALSKGNQQKVQLIAALLGEPDLLILDEPFSGLDPINQELVLNILKDYRAAGKGVLLSAHQMALVERIADAVLLLNQGRVFAKGTLAEVRLQLDGHQHYRAVFAQPLSANDVAKISALDSVQRLEPKEASVDIYWQTNEPLQPLLSVLTLLPAVLSITQSHTSLHDLYLQALQTKPVNKEVAA